MWSNWIPFVFLGGTVDVELAHPPNSNRRQNTQTRMQGVFAIKAELFLLGMGEAAGRRGATLLEAIIGVILFAILVVLFTGMWPALVSA